MTSKMFLDILGVITTSKLGILKTFQGGGAVSAPPPMSSRVNTFIILSLTSSNIVVTCCHVGHRIESRDTFVKDIIEDEINKF